MKNRTLTVVGLALCAAGLVAVNWAIYELVQVGTCASGGPYVSARQCPDGTGLKVLAIFAGICVGLIGTALSGRGTLMWSLLFLSLAGSALAAGPNLGVVIMAAVFIPMGIAPLVFAFLTRDKGDDSVPTPLGADVLAPAPVWAKPPGDRADES